MSNFKIGEKVVCIDDTNQNNHTLKTIGFVKINEIYTIKGFSSEGGLLLEELSGGFWFDGEEAGFKITRFRKLDYQFAEDVCAELIADAKRETILN